jgi:hypothetical protein
MITALRIEAIHSALSFIIFRMSKYGAIIKQ